MAEEPQQKWQGKNTTKIPDYTAEQIWPLLSDYCNLHKWIPFLHTCTLFEGTRDQPGCVRYCAVGESAEGAGGRTDWAKERLLVIDPLKQYFTYEITENNIGFRSYVATMKLFPAEEDNKQKGCEIEWSFVCDPAEGWKLEDLVSKLAATLDAMARRMEEAIRTTSI